MGEKQRPIIDIDFLKKNLKRPKKAVVTGGMPYANGPVHLGHLAGAHIPPDIYARYLRMLIGDDNVLFICGTDDHGSATELASIKENKNIEDFLREARQKHEATFDQFNISFDNYTSTSASETISTHSKTVQNFIRALDKNSMLQKIVSKQWYDLKYQRFLQDRFVTGECPKCSDPKAYSDSCDACGAQYDPVNCSMLRVP